MRREWVGLRTGHVSLNSFVQREGHKIPNKLQHGVKGLQYQMWLEEEREILPLEGTGAYQQLDLRLQASRSVGE